MAAQFAFGEMVSLLWQDGNTQWAVRLEGAGELIAGQPLLLLSSDGREF
jgi:hypothetical protein